MECEHVMCENKLAWDFRILVLNSNNGYVVLNVRSDKVFQKMRICPTETVRIRNT